MRATLLAEYGLAHQPSSLTAQVSPAQAADPALAQHLGVEPKTPILVMRQSIVDSAGRPLLSSTVRYVGDRYRLRTSFSRARKPGAR